MASDGAMLLFAVAASAVAGGGPVPGPGWTLVYGALVLTTLTGRGSYRTRLQTSVFDHVAEVLVATALATSFVITARVVLENEPFAAAETVRLWGFSAVYLFAGRIGFNIATHAAHRRGLPTLVVGAGHVGQAMAGRLQERPEMGLRPVGFLDSAPRPLKPGSPPVLGGDDDFERVVLDHGIEQVLVTFSNAPTDLILRLTRRARALEVEVALVPRYFEEVHRRLSVEHLGGVALLRVGHVDARSWQFAVKYALDRVVASLMLIPLAPLLGLLAVLVRVSSPGPVLFRQLRMGRDGREFEILKFRTIRLGQPGQEQDAAWAAGIVGAEGDAALATPDEDRRTPIGNVLRRLSLDELPQLVNIGRGDMSFVGPRPERLSYAELFGEKLYRYNDRLRVESGLTGWAQVQGFAARPPSRTASSGTTTRWRTGHPGWT